MKSKIYTIAKVIFFLSIAGLLAWLPLRNLTAAERNQILLAFSNVHAWVIIPVFIAGFASHLSRARRWQLLISTSGTTPKLDTTFYAVIIGYIANLALPRMGEVLRCGIINRYEKIQVAPLIGTMLIERLVDVLFLLVIISITALTQSSLFFRYMIENNINFDMFINFFTKISLFKILIMVGIVVCYFIVRYLTKKYKINALLSDKWIGFKLGFGSINNVENKLEFWFHSVFIWLMYFCMMYMAFWCLDITSHLGIAATFSLLAFGSIGMLVTQGGIGAYPLIIGATLVLYDIPFQPSGLAFGWLIWVAQTAIIIVLGVISLLLLQFTKKPINYQKN